jgi:GxxExxY protein
MIEGGLRLDLFVDRRIIIDLKAVENTTAVHRAQILTYLRISGCRLGFLVKFNVPKIKEGIERFII